MYSSHSSVWSTAIVYKLIHLFFASFAWYNARSPGVKALLLETVGSPSESKIICCPREVSCVAKKSIASRIGSPKFVPHPASSLLILFLTL